MNDAEIQVARRLQMLAEATRELAEARLDLDAILERTARYLGEALGDVCLIRLFSSDQRWLVARAFYHPDPETRATFKHVLAAGPKRVGEGASGRVAQSGEPLFIPTLAPGQLCALAQPEHDPYLERDAPHSLAVVPLQAQGSVIGTLGMVRNRTSAAYTEDDLALLQDLAGRAALAIENAQLYARAIQAEREQNKTLMLLDAILETSPVGQAFVDRDLRFLWVNDTLAALNGLPVAAHLGHSVHEILPILAPAIEQLCRQVLESGQAILDVEMTGATPGSAGEERHWLVGYFPVRDRAGQMVGVGGVVQDITDLKRASALLEQRVAERTSELALANQQLQSELADRRQLERASQLAKAEAEHANRVKSEFLANMSHEIRTPLNSIIGFAELLHDGLLGPVASSQKEYLGDILNSATHLLRLVNDVLDLAKVEAGRIEFAPEAVNLSVLVTEVRNNVQVMAVRKRIQIHIRVDPALGQVTIDPGKLKQVLYNYLSNAIKFTPNGGQVFVRVAPEGTAHFRLEVEDTGIGIKSEDLGRLFVEFQQLDPSRSKRYSGTGLGLALTRRIVEAQGGKVGVRSRPGQGSAFFAVLPRRASMMLDSQTVGDMG